MLSFKVENFTDGLNGMYWWELLMFYLLQQSIKKFILKSTQITTSKLRIYSWDNWNGVTSLPKPLTWLRLTDFTIPIFCETPNSPSSSPGTTPPLNTSNTAWPSLWELHLEQSGHLHQLDSRRLSKQKNALPTFSGNKYSTFQPHTWHSTFFPTLDYFTFHL